MSGDLKHHDEASSHQERNSRTGKRLLTVAICMFVAGFAFIPLYRIVCEKIAPGGSAALNGKSEPYENVTVDTSRKLNVRMITNVNRGLPWEFRVDQTVSELHPGQKGQANFFARNYDKQTSVMGKAVYDINPPEAGKYFKKIECFCFQQQELGGGQSIDMPLIYWFDPAIPPHIKNITIAYTFFNMESSFAKSSRKQAALTP